MSDFPNGLNWWQSLLGALVFMVALVGLILGLGWLDRYQNPGDYE